jgi:enoyl-CoA hydratase/carnithine racemase
MPFHVAYRDGVLHLTLETPNCDVNIFDRASAEQLLKLLPNLSVADTRAVILRTAKPQSFINGVGLLLIQAARTTERIRVAGEFFRAAYHAVRDCAVPTIAAVRGNCWGCGVEFLLNCRYRIAADTQSTNFFMTEVINYLLFPTFDGVHNLPVQVGLKNAIDLVLWGERWTAGRAMREGLVNEVADHHCFEDAADGFVGRVLAGEVASCIPSGKRYPWTAEVRAVRDEAEARIAALPPDYQPVYRDCLRQMELAARKESLDPDDHAETRASEARSILSRAGKSAHSYFYIQQIAGQLPPRRGEVPGAPRLSFSPERGAFSDFTEDLVSRLVEGYVVTRRGGESGGVGCDRLMVEPAACRDTPARLAVEVDVRLEVGPARDGSLPLLLYNPIWGINPRFFELAAKDGGDELVDVSSYLRRAGLIVVPTCQEDARPGMDLMLEAFLRPLVGYVLTGGRVRDVNFTLRELGFIRRPATLLEGLGLPAVARLLTGAQGSELSSDHLVALRGLGDSRFEGGRSEPALLDALVVSLAAFAHDAIRASTFSHPTLIDVAARECLDFPLIQKSLCNWLSRSRVAGSLKGSGRGEEIVEERAIRAAWDYVGSGRGFYL